MGYLFFSIGRALVYAGDKLFNLTKPGWYLIDHFGTERQIQRYTNARMQEVFAELRKLSTAIAESEQQRAPPRPVPMRPPEGLQ